MNFGQAIEALKEGKKVARAGWNGKNMWLVILQAAEAYPSMYEDGEEGCSYVMQDCIGLKNAQDQMQPGWTPSQPDMFAKDWAIVE